VRLGLTYEESGLRLQGSPRHSFTNPSSGCTPEHFQGLLQALSTPEIQGRPRCQLIILCWLLKAIQSGSSICGSAGWCLEGRSALP